MGDGVRVSTFLAGHEHHLPDGKGRGYFEKCTVHAYVRLSLGSVYISFFLSDTEDEWKKSGTWFRSRRRARAARAASLDDGEVYSTCCACA